MKRILIKGAGEIASATAHRLFLCGYKVIMTEIEKPTAVRLKVSFCSSVFEKESEVEGVKGVSYSLSDNNFLSSFKWDHIPVFVDPEALIKNYWEPDVIIDGRILKFNFDNKVSDAPLVIGFGPGLEAGKDVHFVIETNRGHNLGRIITKGMAEKDTGIPGSINGFSEKRVLKAPVSGKFISEKVISQKVETGEVIGMVGNVEIKSEIKGIIRGLIYNNIEVITGLKIGDIDPRGDFHNCFTISDKARNISGSALEIISRSNLPNQILL